MAILEKHLAYEIGKQRLFNRNRTISILLSLLFMALNFKVILSNPFSTRYDDPETTHHHSRKVWNFLCNLYMVVAPIGSVWIFNRELKQFKGSLQGNEYYETQSFWFKMLYFGTLVVCLIQIMNEGIVPSWPIKLIRFIFGIVQLFLAQLLDKIWQKGWFALVHHFLERFAPNLVEFNPQTLMNFDIGIVVRIFISYCFLAYSIIPMNQSKPKTLIPKPKEPELPTCQNSSDESVDKMENLSTNSDKPQLPKPVSLPKMASSALLNKILKTMGSTTKSDKYVRLVCNVLKIMRARSSQMKGKYSQLYKQLQVLRQVIRWNGFYETVQEWRELGRENFSRKHLFGFIFSLFSLFGDVLDRIIFVLQLNPNKNWEQFLAKVQQLESDCYFIECVVSLITNSLGLWKLVKQEGEEKAKKIKAAKVLKYMIDCVTSYSKFRGRRWEVGQRNGGILGVISSLLGLYTILA